MSSTALALSAAQAPEPSPSPDARLARVQERRRSLEREVAGLRGQETTLLGRVERLELEVRLRGEQLREIQLLMQATHRELDATVQRLRALEGSLAASRPALAARARALYKMGELSYLRLLLSVDRPADFLRGYRFVTALARGDRERVARFRRELEEASEARAELEARSREAQALRAEADRARRALDQDRRRQTALLTEIVQRKETQAEYLRELEEAEALLTRVVEGLAESDVPLPIAAFRGALPWPVEGPVRSAFGKQKHPRFETYTVQHGIEIAAPGEAPVRAVHEGAVAFADRFRGYGLLVILDHGGKRHSLYAHLGEAAVKVGERVRAGDEVGRLGPAGAAEPGLYFEVRSQGRPEDPLTWLAPRPAPASSNGSRRR